MTLPNFLIIGAAKGGTTSLYYYLDQHPQVYMSPVKEPRFFALEDEDLNFCSPDELFVENSILDFGDYCQLFEGATNEVAIGEASPLYLYSTKAPSRIKHYIPDIKLIAILRDPVDRAYSSYMHYVREGYEQCSFAKALAVEEQRIHENWVYMWYYKRCGYYHEQIKRYLDTFDASQIKICLYDDLKANTPLFLQDIFSFLNVDSSFVPDLSVLNASGVPKSRLLYNFLDRGNPARTMLKVLPHDLRRAIAKPLRKWNLEKPTLPPEVGNDLRSVYRDDILKLQDLIDRDLSSWLLVS
ncbi:sulfotransferase [Acaryochloris marina]|uniref:sulfotransferase family protein n=1 Tax=Acaryochloris marina TaxID=155978 RepID=UPI001BAEAB19|nr:sulfotransferase [Acaryochloris marina]QUY44823.1 sulfotransferase [Acaryochloris marina S15]